MQRRLSIPAILISALALGLWIGASWHAGGVTAPDRCCNSAASSAHVQPHFICACAQLQKISVSSISQAQESCAACHAGLATQDVPLVLSVVECQALATPNATPPFIAPLREVARLALPPQRGPPA